MATRVGEDPKGRTEHRVAIRLNATNMPDEVVVFSSMSSNAARKYWFDICQALGIRP